MSTFGPPKHQRDPTPLGALEARSAASMTHASQKRSDLYPNVGELWDCDGRLSIICGNGFDQNSRIWIMDWSNGDRGSATANQLALRPDRYSVNDEHLVERFVTWSRQGNPDALWWLAWWHSGVNHRKSVWYYVAALRANPQDHGWSQTRIMADARYAGMCEGYARPDTRFVQRIPEMRGQAIGRNWRRALKHAEAALDVPAENAMRTAARRTSTHCD
jgi:hypothetical protein